VHDASGYQPVAWLTRADTVAVEPETVTATDGDQSLTVTVHDEYARSRYRSNEAGTPVGTCPDCKASLVRSGGGVSCPDCDDSYSLPADATVLEERCPDCGLPQFRAQRGQSFEVCLDYECESLDDRVRAAFDRAFDCPDCGENLRVLRRGGLLLGCDAYPDCETSFSFPVGRHDGTCGCGLPVFETPTDRRCLDGGCQADSPGRSGGSTDTRADSSG
jgi:DNA topoisomerase-1